jgi:hypothetical protein
MRPRTAPDVSTVSPNIAAPSVGDVRCDVPPVEMPALPNSQPPTPGAGPLSVVKHM